MRFRLLLGVCVVALSLQTGSAVQAGGFHPSWGAGPWGGGHIGFSQPAIDQQRWTWRPFSLNRSLGYIPTPPYFALSPPVYYSHAVAAPYGVSPAPIASYAPATRYYYEQPAPEPQVVFNPYVNQEDLAFEAESPMPQVVDQPPTQIEADPEPAIIENGTIDSQESSEDELPAPAADEADETEEAADDADFDPFGFEG